MKQMLAGWTALGVLAAMTFPASAEDTTEKVGGWTITTAPQPGKEIDPVCVLASPRDSDAAGFRLTNVLDGKIEGATRGAARIELLLPDALSEEKKGAIAGVTIEVPGQEKWSDLRAAWRAGKSGGSLIAVVEPKIDAVVQPLSRGKTLEAMVPRDGAAAHSYSIDLAGSYGALVAYEKCLAKVKWTVVEKKPAA